MPRDGCSICRVELSIINFELIRDTDYSCMDGDLHSLVNVILKSDIFK
ncbi:hypothetical protein MAR621_00150 [Maribacter dokdonensis]|nr:hypothetical protein MAR621_00150 [Maribacter dokdonensis]